MAIADDHIVLGPFDLVQAEQALLRGDKPTLVFAVVTRERADWWPNGIVPFALHHMYGRDGVGGAADDDYGATLLVHNFDSHPGGDDYPDLVVGAPGRANDRGSVFLYKGSATGFVLWKNHHAE